MRKVTDSLRVKPMSAGQWRAGTVPSARRRTATRHHGGREPHPNTPRSAPPVSDVWLNIVMVVVFVLIGGVFSGAEIALVSLRESQVRGAGRERPARAARGQAARPTPTASSPPSRSASPSPASSPRPSAPRRCPTPLADRSWSAAGSARALADAAGASSLVTVAISYLSLVVGELTPKRLALQRAEGFGAARRPAAQPRSPRCPGRSSGCSRRRPTCWSGCSAATRRSAASRSARRSCATWSPRTSR